MKSKTRALWPTIVTTGYAEDGRPKVLGSFAETASYCEECTDALLYSNISDDSHLLCLQCGYDVKHDVIHEIGMTSNDYSGSLTVSGLRAVSKAITGHVRKGLDILSKIASRAIGGVTTPSTNLSNLPKGADPQKKEGEAKATEQEKKAPTIETIPEMQLTSVDREANELLGAKDRMRDSNKTHRTPIDDAADALRGASGRLKEGASNHRTQIDDDGDRISGANARLQQSGKDYRTPIDDDADKISGANARLQTDRS